MTRLVIFDVDGTLVDSQAEILTAMGAAFAAESLPMPPRAAVLAIVGLSLPQAFARLCPAETMARHDRLTVAYKAAYNDRRTRMGGAAGGPLFPGAREVLAALVAMGIVLAVATGKSRRGLDAVLGGHGLSAMFASTQVADDHPSKPHPAMILAALAETGIPAARTVMIGDTTFDMDMGRAAGVRTVAVSWGYHPVASLQGDAMISHFSELPGVVDRLLGPVA
jgi:phosphoglycolate phosphatase